MTIRALLALTLALASPLAHAEFYSGASLLRMLEAGDRIDRGVGQRGDGSDSALGMGFLAGVYDVYVDAAFCSRPGITLGQVTSVALLYLRAVPHRHHEVAFILVKESLERAFPCEQRRQPQQGRSL